MRWPWKREKRDAPIDPSWAALIDRGALSASGAFVDSKTAESIATVHAAVNLIAGTVASLPLHLYQRGENGDRVRASDHPLYRVLHDAPNERQTALEFREQLTAHCLLWGNAYAEIHRDAAGTVTALTPIHPRDVTIVKLPSGRLRYDVSEGGELRRLLADEVLHLRDRSDDGLVGKSRITTAREMLGGILAQQEHGNRTFANGAKLSGVLKTPHVLDKGSAERISESWRQQFGGAANSGKVAVLEHGLEFQPLSMSNEDAQWLAARQFSVEEVARLFNVPPVLLGDLRHANFSNSVEMMRHFVTVTLRPWLARWEQALERALMGPIARNRYFIEFSAEGLLRGDAKHRAEFYKSGIEAGWLLRSEARRLENLPTVEGIDDGPTEDA
ncbi:phage portal protein [Pseudoxanthomonas taiwanensis]|uniref:Phage portal protein n=1 Tax=Pseudoxanthomonas taiwanensis TaxID=176598 RepID=A0A921TIS7_9GAMM|nr:phage portal protein [Pseudoxanthomonas taiwanensis]KAF1690197.1 phage portal protein [Pseudoxanthomonas taiwanensis]